MPGCCLVRLQYIFSSGPPYQRSMKKPVIDTKIQWGVFVVVFIPIAVGLMIFGYYAIKGEYDHLPESSAELEED